MEALQASALPLGDATVIKSIMLIRVIVVNFGSGPCLTEWTQRRCVNKFIKIVDFVYHSLLNSYKNDLSPNRKKHDLGIKNESSVLIPKSSF
jgi:hypothetical protein